MYKNMAEFRRRQRAKSKYYKALRRLEEMPQYDPEEEGFVNFKNLFGESDPTPAKADRRDYS